MDNFAWIAEGLINQILHLWYHNPDNTPKRRFLFSFFFFTISINSTFITLKWSEMGKSISTSNIYCYHSAPHPLKPSPDDSQI